MPANFIELDRTKARSQRIIQALQAIREGRAILNQELASTIQCVQGDGSEAVHFTLLAAKFGAVANDYPTAAAAAQAAYNELASLAFILNRGAGQGDAAGAALDQCCAKFGA